MNIKLDDKVLMDMVFKCLCRVLKNRKIYHRFRCFIGYGGMGSKNVYSHDLTTTIYSNMNSMQHYVAEAQNGDNPFYHTASTEDIFKLLKMALGDDNEITKENCRDASKVQMRIMQCLNTLLHSCVERTVGGFAEVERTLVEVRQGGVLALGVGPAGKILLCPGRYLNGGRSLLAVNDRRSAVNLTTINTRHGFHRALEGGGAPRRNEIGINADA